MIPSFAGVEEMEKGEKISTVAEEAIDEYDLLIICPSNWVEQLQPLKEHKEKYGIKTIIVSLDEIYGGKYFATQGRDDAEKVKYFIKDAIENWGIEYVMLVGGRKFSKEEWIMPVRYAYSIDKVPPFTENGYLSDLYFADIYDANGNFSSWDTNGNGIYAEYDYNGRYDDVDLYPDVYVGRLPCRNKLELKIVVNKIIRGLLRKSIQQSLQGSEGTTFSCLVCAKNDMETGLFGIKIQGWPFGEGAESF